jgi:sigma-B regulation protein RsbU (phosphoserine phosphatase)
MGDAPTMLAIDDDHLVRRVVRRMLEHKGWQVLEAADGPSGLALFRARRPDAVLLDLRMPGMDGLDVLSAMVQEVPETPVVVFSGEGTMSDAIQALRRGAWDFVSKPVTDSELLLRAVSRALEKAVLLRQNREYADSLKQTNQRLTAALDELRADEQAARLLQFQLLPEDGFSRGGYSCFRRLFPSQLLSGDFLDYFALGSRFLGFYLADVAGHGAAAAFVTAILTTLVMKYREALSARGDETILHPERLLTRLDADLSALQLAMHVTMFYAVVDLDSHALRYGNAGAFPFPFFGDDGEVRELEGPGRPLNLPGAPRFAHGEVAWGPGARLLVVSDGVLELDGGKSYRDQRQVLAAVTKRAASIEAVLAELDLHETTPHRDDIALLFLRREASHA